MSDLVFTFIGGSQHMLICLLIFFRIWLISKGETPSLVLRPPFISSFHFIFPSKIIPWLTFLTLVNKKFIM